MDGMVAWKSPWQTRQTETGSVKTFYALSFFSIFCAAVVFSSLVAVLVKKVEKSHRWSGSRGMAGMAFWYKHRALCAGQRAIKGVLESYIVEFELQLQAQKVQ
jgi:hypothetical protein